MKTLLILFGAIVASLQFLQAAPEKKSRPNIVVIMTDDMGYADTGFNGATDIKTPSLDRLAADGTICTSGYAAHPFCGPSRAGLMTGRYPHEFGSQYNLPRNSDTIVGFGVPLNEPFISKVLKEAGYYTGAVGKWHIGAADGYQPTARGFDDFFGFRGGGHKYFPEKFHASYDKLVKAGEKNIIDYICPLERNGKEVRETEYLTDAFSREAARFVKDAAKKDQPFFLYLAYNAPHSPMEAPAQDLAFYKDISDPKRRVYAAMVHAVDRGVGELVKALKETKEFDNTLIVFLSDNGGKLKYGSDNSPLTGEKGETTEGGYRVPMFFHWPSKIPGGKKYDHPVSALDFYPTFASLAGARIADGKNLDGVDVFSALQSGKSARKGSPLFAMRYQGKNTLVGIRQDQWKATRTGGKWSLYNLDQDIGEKNDLSSQHLDLRNGLIAEAKRWSAAHVAPLWTHNQEIGKEWNPDIPDFDQLFQTQTPKKE